MTETPTQIEDASSGAGLLTDPRLTGVRLTVHCYLRFAVAVAIALGAVFASNVVGIDALDVKWLSAVALVIALYNIAVMVVIAPFRRRDKAEGAHRLLITVWHATVTADYLALAVLIYLVGGARSPFLAFFLLHLVLSAIMLSRRAAYVHSAIAYLILCALVGMEWMNLLTPELPVGAVITADPLDGRYALTILVVYGVLFVVTSFLLTSLASLVRSGEQRLSDANTELQRLNQYRRDFLHVALHNLKSPVGAVITMLKTMRGEYGGPVTEQQREWLDRCVGRLEGSTDFLRDLQTLAAIESGNLAKRMEAIDLKPMLQEMVEENRDLAEQREHQMTVDVPDDLPAVQGIDRLIREAIVNFITNAIKYTPVGGRIVVRAVATVSAVTVEVEDNGIGISAENQGRLFQDFVRIERPDSAVADAPGTGLGLSIVKRIIEAHDGSVAVRSAIDEGSTFLVTLPRA